MDSGGLHDNAYFTREESLEAGDEERLDKQVLDDMALYGYRPGPMTQPMANHLLVSIVMNSDGRLDSKYSDTRLAADFLQKHEDVFNQLDEAWRVKSFGKIRQHGRSPWLLNLNWSSL
jgi:hypothetical protein